MILVHYFLEEKLTKMWQELWIIFLVTTGCSGFVNVVHTRAYGGKAAMTGTPQHHARNADAAIDGNISQDYRSNSCAITEVDEDKLTESYWKVWLTPKPFNIAYLEIYFRSDTYTRSTGFSIYTYNTETFYPFTDPKHLIYRHDPLSGCPSPIMNVTVNYVTQGIVFINERPPGYTSNCLNDNTQYVGIEICEIKVMGCDSTRYSPGCNHRCPSKCRNSHCDVFNGSCIHGCSNPNALTMDCLACPDGQYISNRFCVPCRGHCKDGTPCNKMTGGCDDGCSNNWTGEYCEKCPPGYYGTDCDTQCGKCAGNEMCDNVTGDCPKGCLGNWQEPKCNDCIDRFYGYDIDCADKCGHCKDNRICNKDTGYCPHGCDFNFQEPRCQVCKPRFYNSTSDCTNRCGHCKNTATCDKESGHCLDGCELHFKDPYCQECRDGYYGDKCHIACGNCLDEKRCDRLNGTCYQGCKDHFKELECTVCEDGFYNSRCNSKCGKCVNSEPCDKVTGECRNGCHLDFEPPLCQDHNNSDQQAETMCNDNELSFIWFYIAIGILVILLAASVGYILFLKRHMSPVQRDKDSTKSKSESGRQNNHANYDNLTVLKESHQYASLNPAANDSHYQELPDNNLNSV